MPLPSSGAISISAINTEFGRGSTAQTSMSQLYRGGGIVTTNNTNVPTSGQIALSNFYGAVNAPPISVNVSFTQCYDGYATAFYDGNGSLFIQSREPNGAIHTNRGDCSGAAQGNILRFSFSKTNYTTINVTISVSGRNGSGSRTINQSVNSTFGPTQVGPSDTSGGAGVYSFTIIGTIT